MEVKRRSELSRVWRMVTMRGHWTQRWQSDWTLKIVVACCIALFFLSPGFSRKLPADSKAYLGRSGTLERSVGAHEVARTSEMRGRILDEVPEIEAEGEAEEDDLTSDYATPTHNHSVEYESSSLPASKTSTRFRASQQFPRNAAQYGHRRLQSV